MLHSCGIGAPALYVLLDDLYGPLTTDEQRLPFVDFAIHASIRRSAQRIDHVKDELHCIGHHLHAFHLTIRLHWLRGNPRSSMRSLHELRHRHLSGTCFEHACSHHMPRLMRQGSKILTSL